ncbi:LysR family transcriptional regulator [Rhodococcus sp. NPDC056960]|uniref:helix-turn-helix domain-containing protein n=1 Tax=Rhodococcus sp. NPDC056960 TaxID=3345982 RepID=UPI003644B845
MTSRPELEQIQHRVPYEPSLPRSLANLDLNLLITLDAVLGHQNATRAAEQLGVTQPAISAPLRRLRRYFDDDLLRRVGNRFQLTPWQWISDNIRGSLSRALIESSASGTMSTSQSPDVSFR